MYFNILSDFKLGQKWPISSHFLAYAVVTLYCDQAGAYIANGKESNRQTKCINVAMNVLTMQ